MCQRVRELTAGVRCLVTAKRCSRGGWNRPGAWSEERVDLTVLSVTADREATRGAKPPGGNRKPLSSKVADALAKAEKLVSPTDTTDGESELLPEESHASVDDPHNIDSELRGEARTIAGRMIRFKELIDKAKTHNVHEALGFKSWPAYIADVINSEMAPLQIDDRRRIVELLAGEGMSDRAIATAVGTTHPTVKADKTVIKAERQVESDLPPEPAGVVGLDGKTQPAKKPRRDVPTPKRTKRTKPEPVEQPVEPPPAPFEDAADPALFSLAGDAAGQGSWSANDFWNGLAVQIDELAIGTESFDPADIDLAQHHYNVRDLYDDLARISCFVAAVAAAQQTNGREVTR